MYVPSIFYKVYEKTLHRQIFADQRPHHVGLIVDGNRRFALAQKLATRKAGHMAGSDNLEGFLRWCLDLEIKMVTLYGFSTENYNRSGEEVEELMSIILSKFRTLKTDPLIADENVKIKVIGRRDQLSQEMNEEIDTVEAQTAEHSSFQLNIAILAILMNSYSPIISIPRACLTQILLFAPQARSDCLVFCYGKAPIQNSTSPRPFGLRSVKLTFGELYESGSNAIDDLVSKLVKTNNSY